MVKCSLLQNISKIKIFFYINLHLMHKISFKSSFQHRVLNILKKIFEMEIMILNFKTINWYKMIQIIIHHNLTVLTKTKWIMFIQVKILFKVNWITKISQLVIIIFLSSYWWWIGLPSACLFHSKLSGKKIQLISKMRKNLIHCRCEDPSIRGIEKFKWLI